MIKAIVVRAVRLGVNGRRNHRHFMTIDGVTAVKMFNLDQAVDYVRIIPLTRWEGDTTTKYFMRYFSRCLSSSPRVD